MLNKNTWRWKWSKLIFAYRWGYNQDTEECEEFNYGGCKGNLNSFLNEEECTNSCANKGTARYSNIETVAKKIGLMSFEYILGICVYYHVPKDHVWTCCPNGKEMSSVVFVYCHSILCFFKIYIILQGGPPKLSHLQYFKCDNFGGPPCIYKNNFCWQRFGRVWLYGVCGCAIPYWNRLGFHMNVW